MDITPNKKRSLILNVSFKIGNDVISFGYKSERKFDEAINKPLDEETIINQMKKSGNTPFIV